MPPASSAPPSAQRDALLRLDLPAPVLQERFDRFAHFAADVLDAPIGVVFVLGSDELTLQRTVGVRKSWGESTRRALVRCVGQHLGSAEAFSIRDLAADIAFGVQPAAEVVSLAGAPLVSQGGQVFGALCVIDSVRRVWTAKHARTLTGVAAALVTELDLRAEASDRTRAETLARQSQLEFQQFAESVRDVLYVIDGAGAKMLFINAAFEQIWGVPRERMYATPNLWRESVHPDDQERVREARPPGRIGTSDLEYRIKRADGSVRWVRDRAFPIRDETGNVHRLGGVAEDVTERRETEEALRASEEHYRVLFDRNPVPMWVYDIETFAFLAVNDAAVRQYGYSREEFLAMTLEDIRPTDEIEQFREAAARARLTPELRSHWRHVTKAGEMIHVELISQEFVLDGRRSRLVVALNMTERRRAEAALAESEQRYRMLVETGHEGVWALDETGATTYANARLADMFGYTSAQMIGRPIFHFVPEEAQESARALLDRRQEGLSDVYEFTFEARSGAPVYTLVSASPVRGEDGEVTGSLAMVTDVGELRRAERAARAGEERFQLVARATQDVIWDWDLITDRLYWSDAAATVFGHAPDDTTGSIQWWYDHVHPDDEARVMTGIKRVIESGGDSWTDEYRYRRSDGSYAVVLDRGYVSRDEGGRPVRMIGSMMDLTERTRAEEAIRFQAHLLDVVEQAVIVTDPTGIVTYWNRSAERLYGWTALEAMGQPVGSLVDVPSYDADRDEMMAKVRSGESVIGETPRRRKDGTTFVATRSASPIYDARGVVVGVVGVSSDATDRHDLEEQFRQAQKMEAIGRLAGGVAHDFNNLLTVIRVNTEMLTADLRAAGQDRPEVDDIRDAAIRASTLTRQLLAFSRKQILKAQVVDVREVVESVVPMLGRLIGEDVRVEAELGAAGHAMADRGQLEQVIVNLAVNARDAMPDGGALVLRTSLASVDEHYAAFHESVTPGRYVLLEVSDSGVGMDAATKARIFEPFFTTKPQGQGTGLGLSTVYGIVKQSGGHIWVYSEPGHGTTFKVYLPEVQPPADDQGDVDRGAFSSSVGAETVLVVEDEASIRTIAERLLRQRGYNVITACDGEEALRIVANHDGPIHLILTDVVMPGASGRVLTERLAAVRPAAKVLYMSGYTDDEVIRRGVLAPGVKLLEKPFTAEALSNAVREALDGPAPTGAALNDQGRGSGN